MTGWRRDSCRRKRCFCGRSRGVIPGSVRPALSLRGGRVAPVRASELIERNRDAWRAATEHPFLAGVREGTLDPARFSAWLGQDYLFAGALLSFQARLLARAPRPAQPTLVRGAAALVDELTWFETQAGQRGLSLAAVPAPSTLDYLALLGRLDTSPTPVALVALWALERVYRDAWQAAAPGAEPYREIVAHWTEPGFADYVAELEHLADIALTDFPSAEQQTVFDEVLRLEIAFWDAATATG
jgi:formylaminopyrimidine deformylase / aminopyrimidine aminohydrolase